LFLAVWQISDRFPALVCEMIMKMFKYLPQFVTTITQTYNKHRAKHIHKVYVSGEDC